VTARANGTSRVLGSLTNPDSSLRAFVSGGAGFIGSHLVDRLLSLGHHVTVYDNLSTGQVEFLREAQKQPRFHMVNADLLEYERLREAVSDQDIVFHLAANADVRFGANHPDRDLQQNVIATHNLLEAMRTTGVDRIVFSSTGSVYGEPGVYPTPEDCPFPVQTSLYGASKVAAEALLCAYAEAFGFQALIFRFVSILGERYSHGHVFDFYKKLAANSSEIEVLGNGKQRKSYLYVGDCIDGIVHALDAVTAQVNVFNLGTSEYCTVDQSLNWICDELGVDPARAYSGGERGWIGDSPFVFLDCARIQGLGWRPSVSIEEAVRRTLRYLRTADWLFAART